MMLTWPVPQPTGASAPSASRAGRRERPYSNRRVVSLALRQLFIVALASAVTFFVGRLFGVLAS